MLINITNESSYQKITIKYDDVSIDLQKNKSYNINTDHDYFEFEAKLSKKNSVIINPLFFLLRFVFDSDDVISTIYCDAKFHISNSSIDDIIDIKITDIEARFKSRYIYESVFCQNQKVSSWYSINSNLGEKKCKFYSNFITSLLPFSLFLFGYFLATGNILSFIAGIVITIVFSVPNWIKSKTATIAFRNDEIANSVLNKTIINREQHNDNIPKDAVGKMFYDVIDRIVKR